MVGKVSKKRKLGTSKKKATATTTITRLPDLAVKEDVAPPSKRDPGSSNSSFNGGERSKKDVLEDYSKMLNSAFPLGEGAPTISDISKNFALKAVPHNDNVFLVVKKTNNAKRKTEKSKPKLTKSANIATPAKIARRRRARSLSSGTKTGKKSQRQGRSRSLSNGRDRRRRRRVRSRRRSSASSSTTTRSKSPHLDRPVRIRGKLALRAPSPSPVADEPPVRKFDVDKYMRGRIPIM